MQFRFLWHHQILYIVCYYEGLVVLLLIVMLAGIIWCFWMVAAFSGFIYFIRLLQHQN